MEHLRTIVLLVCALSVVMPVADAEPASDEPDADPAGGTCVDIHPDTPANPVEVYDC